MYLTGSEAVREFLHVRSRVLTGLLLRNSISATILGNYITYIYIYSDSDA